MDLNRGNCIFAINGKNDRPVLFWILFMATVMAILIVEMNAIAARYRTRNVVNFYPCVEDANVIENSSCDPVDTK